MSGFFIYMTNAGKQTNPSTQLQTDANGIPVQPLNPSTGSGEQTYSNMNSYNPNMYGNSNSNGMNPTGDYGRVWDGRPIDGAPPQGAYGTPYPVYPTGNSQQVFIDPCASNSQFMPQDCNQIVNVPVNRPANVNSQVNGKKPNANVNTNTQTAPTNTNTTAKPTPTVAANTAVPPIVKPTPALPKPKTMTTPQPKKSPPPAATDNRSTSGNELNT